MRGTLCGEVGGLGRAVWGKGGAQAALVQETGRPQQRARAADATPWGRGVPRAGRRGGPGAGGKDLPVGLEGSQEVEHRWGGGRVTHTLMVPVALQTETLLLQAERRALCACWPSGR